MLITFYYYFIIIIIIIIIIFIIIVIIIIKLNSAHLPNCTCCRAAAPRLSSVAVSLSLILCHSVLTWCLCSCCCCCCCCCCWKCVDGGVDGCVMAMIVGIVVRATPYNEMTSFHRLCALLDHYPPPPALLPARILKAFGPARLLGYAPARRESFCWVCLLYSTKYNKYKKFCCCCCCCCWLGVGTPPIRIRIIILVRLFWLIWFICIVIFWLLKLAVVVVVLLRVCSMPFYTFVIKLLYFFQCQHNLCHW